MDITWDTLIQQTRPRQHLNVLAECLMTRKETYKEPVYSVNKGAESNQSKNSIVKAQDFQENIAVAPALKNSVTTVQTFQENIAVALELKNSMTTVQALQENIAVATVLKNSKAEVQDLQMNIAGATVLKKSKTEVQDLQETLLPYLASRRL